jgi:hypothetical protein
MRYTQSRAAPTLGFVTQIRMPLLLLKRSVLRPCSG